MIALHNRPPKSCPCPNQLHGKEGLRLQMELGDSAKEIILNYPGGPTAVIAVLRSPSSGQRRGSGGGHMGTSPVIAGEMEEVAVGCRIP